MLDLKIKARFIEPMLLQRAEKLPQGGAWEYDLSSMASSFNLFDPGLEWCFPGPRNLAKAMRLPGELSRNSTPITGDWRAAYPE